jgi:hypothetical protein
MQAHGAIEILELHMLDWTDFNDAGVVNQDVDLAEAIDGLTDGRLNLPGIEQITLNGNHPTATSRQISFCADQFLIVPRKERHFAASSTNLSRQHQTEATRSAGDKRNFVS